jgi:formylglycine-generating enzyme
MRVFRTLLVLALLLFALSCKTNTEPDVVGSPVFTPAAGTYNMGQEVTITCPTENAEIRYTTDGSEPNSDSPLYTVPLILPDVFPAKSVTGTIKAKAYKEDWTSSEIVSAEYTVTTMETVATPTYFPHYGGLNLESVVTLSCSTEGAEIRYTLDGSDPTSTSTLYTQPLEINELGAVTVKAIAYKIDWLPSAMVTLYYIVFVKEPGMIMVPGGTFNNGTSDVTVSSFYMGNLETTQAEYVAVMGSNPSEYTGNVYRPVEHVSWFNAIEYCNKRSVNEGRVPCYSYLTYGTDPETWPNGWDTSDANHTNVSCSWTANGYRLPTEAEWEYAARGAYSTHGYTYSGSNDIDEVAWYVENNTPVGPKTVGCKKQNELYIYDMSGNVFEWIWDIIDSYATGPQTDPHGPDFGGYRVNRGGSWVHYAPMSEVDSRSSAPSTCIDRGLGFRVCRTLG